MAAANTYIAKASGPTFWSAQGTGSRVDYICLPISAFPLVQKLEVWRRTAHEIQVIRSAVLRDRSPIFIRLAVPEFYPEQSSGADRWDYDAIAKAKATADRRHPFLTEIQRWRRQPEVQQEFAEKLQAADTDAVWDHLNAGVIQISKKHFSQQQQQQQRISDKTQALSKVSADKYKALVEAEPIPLQQFVNGKVSKQQLLRTVLRSWSAAAQSRCADRAYHKAQQADKRRHTTHLEVQIDQAKHEGNISAMWHFARQLAGTGLGPKRRRWAFRTTEFPTAQEWMDHLAQPGPRGGCSAKGLQIQQQQQRLQQQQQQHQQQLEQIEIQPSDETKEARLMLAAARVFREQQRQQQQLQQTPQQRLTTTFARWKAEVLVRQAMRLLKYHRERDEQQQQQQLQQTTTFRFQRIEQAVNDYDNMIFKLRKAKSRKQSPPWSVPSEIWQLLLFNEESQIAMDLQSLCHHIRATASTPRVWHHSMTAPIPKYNGKAGPASMRLINELDPIGRAWHAALWMNATPRRFYFAHAAKDHRREQAILQQRLLGWRLAAAGLNFVMTKFDIANAFPSPTFQALDEMVNRHLQPVEAALMRQRYHNGAMTIHTQDDTNVQLAIGSGVLQGDSTAAEQFTAVFNPTVASYIAQLSEEDITANLLLQDELTGDQVDPSTTTYADDLVTTATVQDAAHAVRQQQQQQLDTLLENNVQQVGLT
ncbi:unnamed protein product [Polarella glacialis]|uniref:Uncharacterized protein n=1 Tax=Polarella glacialis TaxID=89957 RepID=A0A813H8M3_POLGL|nr:unnamed protein product [Polarella glacialis]